MICAQGRRIEDSGPRHAGSGILDTSAWTDRLGGPEEDPASFPVDTHLTR
jgi:hypothetical protein